MPTQVLSTHFEYLRGLRFPKLTTDLECRLDVGPLYYFSGEITARDASDLVSDEWREPAIG